MKKPIYVTGHQRPDTDSIVSAIAYAEFKKKQGIDATAIRLGKLSQESEYLLEKFGIEEPPIMYSARCSLKEIDLDAPKTVDSDLTVKQALKVIHESPTHTIYITDKNGQLKGLISLSDLDRIFTMEEEDRIRLLSSLDLDDILKAVNGRLVNERKDIGFNGRIIFPSTFIEKYDDNSLIVVHDLFDIDERCLSKKMIALVYGQRLEAIKNEYPNIEIIETPLDPQQIIRELYQALTIDRLMTTEMVIFNENESIEDANSKISKTRYRAYPVINNEGILVGSLSRYHLINYRKKRFILVDHNEKKQTISDIDFAEIVEVIDHHKLGDLETANPVDLTFMSVGATATIITKKYLDQNVELDKNIASILLGAIITDTLDLKSPTTTDLDRKMYAYLCEYTGIDGSKLASELSNTSESILDKRFIDIVFDDYKEYVMEGHKIAIAQTQCRNREEVESIREGLCKYMDDTIMMNSYDLLLVMLTNNLGSGSYLIYRGTLSPIVESAFMDSMNADGYVDKLLSRKKQVVPALMDAIVR
ncbi:MAG: putative manganese-dependent inorganic diphosphatase [Erysipelotrichaceae bacterium]|nr:putative manganese-dependent inorganic diphosphatase [Erysipelotrichaceae bacterium]